MVRDDLIYAGHMLDIARSAVNKIARRSRADFDGDENLRLALAHLVQTIGEAARHVSAEFQAHNLTIPRSKVVGKRHGSVTLGAERPFAPKGRRTVAAGGVRRSRTKPVVSGDIN